MTRKYEQRLRAQAAEETRRRILDAVYQRLSEAPAQQVSVDQVARAAGVARSTVYLIFGSRAGLFDAFAADLLWRAGFEGIRKATRKKDARDRVATGLVAGARMFSRHRDVMRSLWSMAAIDPGAFAGAIGRLDERRREGTAELAQWLEDTGALRDGLTADEAHHVIWMLSSFDAFDLLYTGKGLSIGQVEDALVQTAFRALFD